MIRPFGIAVGADDQVYVTDANNRVQVFEQITLERNSKAIIVAGGVFSLGTTCGMSRR